MDSFNRNENVEASQKSRVYLMLEEHTPHICAHSHLHTTSTRTQHPCTYHIHPHTTSMHTLHPRTHHIHAHTISTHTLHPCTHNICAQAHTLGWSVSQKFPKFEAHGVCLRARNTRRSAYSLFEPALAILN